MPSIGVGTRPADNKDDLQDLARDELRGYVMCLRDSLWDARLESDKFKMLWDCAMRELENLKKIQYTYCQTGKTVNCAAQTSSLLHISSSDTPQSACSASNVRKGVDNDREKASTISEDSCSGNLKSKTSRHLNLESKGATSLPTKIEEKYSLEENTFRDSHGKWKCPKCLIWNRNIDCENCKFAPTLKESPQGSRRDWVVKGNVGGSWKCPKCHNWNLNIDSTCYQCKIRPKFIDKNASEEGDAKIRPDLNGAWKCPKCKEWNGGLECFECKFAPVFEEHCDDTAQKFGFIVPDRAGAWFCSNCDAPNFIDHHVCYRCKIRPDFIDQTVY